MPATKTVTVDSLIAKYADGVAFVAEEQPATTVHDFTYQIGVAAEYFEGAGINGGDELEAGAQYLADAHAAASDTERSVLLGKAAEYLARTNDLVDEYRLML